MQGPDLRSEDLRAEDLRSEDLRAENLLRAEDLLPGNASGSYGGPSCCPHLLRGKHLRAEDLRSEDLRTGRSSCSGRSRAKASGAAGTSRTGPQGLKRSLE